MPEVCQVWKCFVCGRAFDSVQALRGHLRVHRGVRLGRLTVRLPAEKVEAFLEACRRHNASSCHVIGTLIDAFLEGEKRGLVNIASPNPVVVHVNQFFLARPRGRGKYDFSSLESCDFVQTEPKCVLCGAPAVGEGVQDSGWRYAYCQKHIWLRNWAPVGRKIEK